MAQVKVFLTVPRRSSKLVGVSDLIAIAHMRRNTGLRSIMLGLLSNLWHLPQESSVRVLFMVPQVLLLLPRMYYSLKLSS